MATIHPWINFNGNSEEAFTFYKSVFGGEFSKITRFKDVPGFEPSEKEANKIMRIKLPIGGAVLVGNDVPEMMGRVSEEENRSKIYVSAESKDEAERVFKGLAAGGTVEMPMDAGPDGGASFAMFRDKYGIEWVVEFDPKNSQK
jgi:PhnB protein